MSCPVCSMPSDSGLCGSCSSVTQKIEALPHVPVLGSGSSRTQIRDRQWLFKHAKEAIASGNSTSADLVSIRDRMPHSRAGTVLRNKLNKRIAALSEIFNPVPVDASNVS